MLTPVVSNATAGSGPDGLAVATAAHVPARDRSRHSARSRGEGVSHFAVFASAPDGVAIQRRFDAKPWLSPRPLKVRIRLHTGEAELRRA